MVITIPVSRQASEGLRPIDIGNDLPQVIELLRLVFGESLDAEDRQWLGQANHTPILDTFARFHPAASRLANGFVWVADGRIIGNVTLLTTKTWGRYLIANVAVHPAYRRQGIARSLMVAATDAVNAQQGRLILLQVVKDNAPAIELYRSLGYQVVGHMTTWYAAPRQVHKLYTNLNQTNHTEIRPLPVNFWREAYQLDTSCVPADLNWPDPLPPQVYQQSIWRRFSDFWNGRQHESWSISDDKGHLAGLVSLFGEWGRVHLISLRVAKPHAGKLERPLLAKIIRRLDYLPKRNIRIDHPDDDQVVNHLLDEANFNPQRTLTHMRLTLR